MPVSFNWRGEKKICDWVLGERVSFYSWAFEISRQFKREREVTGNEAAKRWRYDWRILAKRHVETGWRFLVCSDLMQMNQERQETYLLTAMIWLLADPFFYESSHFSTKKKKVHVSKQ